MSECVCCLFEPQNDFEEELMWRCSECDQDVCDNCSDMDTKTGQIFCANCNVV